MRDKLSEIKALCERALDVLENDGEYHAEDLADQVIAIIAGCDVCEGDERCQPEHWLT